MGGATMRTHLRESHHRFQVTQMKGSLAHEQNQDDVFP